MNNEKVDMIFGTSAQPEYYMPIYIPELTLREKFIVFLHGARDLIKQALWLMVGVFGMSLQIGGLAYVAGIMFKKGFG